MNTTSAMISTTWKSLQRPCNLMAKLHAYQVGMNTWSGTEVILLSFDWLMRLELGYFACSLISGLNDGTATLSSIDPFHTMKHLRSIYMDNEIKPYSIKTIMGPFIYMFSVHVPEKMFSKKVLGTRAFRFKIGTHLGLHSMTYYVYTAQRVEE